LLTYQQATSATAAMNVCIKDWILLLPTLLKLYWKFVVRSAEEDKRLSCLLQVLSDFTKHNSLNVCYKYRTVVPLLTRCFYETMQASKSARYLRFDVIAILAMKNTIFLSMKPFSLVENIRSHISIPPHFQSRRDSSA